MTITALAGYSLSILGGEGWACASRPNEAPRRQLPSPQGGFYCKNLFTGLQGCRPFSSVSLGTLLGALLANCSASVGGL